MNNKWTVASVNGQKNGQEGEWKSLDQIQGQQTLLVNNMFGISFRIIPSRFEKFSDIYIEPNMDNREEADKNNDTIRYKISEFGINTSNPYYILLKKSGIDMNEVCETLKERLEEGEWSWLNVQGLREYGVVEGIHTKLGHEDNEKGSNNAKDFFSDSALKKMGEIEYAELLNLKGTDEECLDIAKLFGGDEEIDSAWAIIYQRYKEIIDAKEKTNTSGARNILEYMKEHGLTVQDLSLALAMAQATKTGVKKAEKHLIDEKTNQQVSAKDEQAQRE